MFQAGAENTDEDGEQQSADEEKEDLFAKTEDQQEHRFSDDPLLASYVASQAGWTEQTKQHWTNKRAKALGKLLTKCAGSEVNNCLEAITSEPTMSAVEQNLKETCHGQ